ncbi:MAG: hypothetical protein ISS56_03660 [Anaerolineae bacterium]|nr:hypothetical protein [Anaerolineae bacterium]
MSEMPLENDARGDRAPGQVGPPHTHGAGVYLEPEARAILARGLDALVRMTEGLAFLPLSSERYPLPLTAAVYSEVPDPDRVRDQVRGRMETDPVSVLEAVLVLLELYECNQPGIADFLPDDAAFLSQAFATKRLNGWIAVLGDADREEVESSVNGRWKFRFVPGRARRTAVYPLLNMLARYGCVYGRIPRGDSHALGHFVEDYGPGLVVCQGKLDDLELTLSLAAMKLGVPAVVPTDYVFPLGRQMRANSIVDVVDSLLAFPNIHRLLDLPEIPGLPDYLSGERDGEKPKPVATWGDTPESFYLLRKGRVHSPGVTVSGEPGGPMGVLLTVDAEPLDAFDRQYIEAHIVRTLSMLPGVSAAVRDGRLALGLGSDVELSPERVGEVLIAAVRHEFPKIQNVRVEVILDPERLAGMVESVRAERAARRQEIASATEESVAEFATCVGCSPFAPDHVCILTPQRPPQCGRSYERIRAGALYSYDDMSDIHHRALHLGMNSYGVCGKGRSIDLAAGEWSGVNEAAARLTGGRTRRIQLHSLDEAPPTGCGCFQLVMFKTEQPSPGIGIMHRGCKGRAPDGRTWADLHYALAGKQTPGIAGASPGYLSSAKFLLAHGGWTSVVWVSSRIAAMMGERLPGHVQVGRDGAQGESG